MGNLLVDLTIGAAAGYLSSRMMDQATGWYWGRQSAASKEREEEVAPGGAPVLGGRRIAAWGGREVSDDEAGRIGFFVHRLLGVLYGVTAAVLVRRGAAPLRAGLMTGAAAFFLVDEAVNSAAFTPPPQAYPAESHMRGVVGHLTYGASAGLLLSVAQRLGALQRPETG